MKKLYYLLIILVFLSCKTEISIDHNEDISADSILKLIHEPSVPEYNINVTDFGAIGDSITKNKIFFQKAIEAIKNNGGGTLNIPKGQYFMDGPIHFTNNMELHLEKEARLFFSSEPKDFLPEVKTSWEGTFIYNYSPFIYARNCQNIRITGEGIIDGEASETWALWKEKQKEDQELSREMNHNHTPVNQRIFGEGHFLRPHLIQLYECKNILIEGVKIEDSPFWCIHLLKCENATVRNIKYEAYNKNNDGIDPEYSKNILIENITFNNSDDNVAIKAGRDDEGRVSKEVSENIIIRNCHFKGLHAIVIGSEMSAGVKNIFVENCDFAGYLKRGIYLKSNPDRGGYIKNVFIKDVQFGEVEDCIYITSFYHNEGEGHITDIKDIYFENISCQKANGSGIVLQGFPEKKLSDIYFKNIRIDSVTNPLSMENTENIILSDVTIGHPATSPSFVK